MKISHIRKPGTQVWHLVDAEDKVLGELAAKVASVLRGKHKPSFTPNLDSGDYVVVINASKIRVTGAKEEDKKYYRHSGQMGKLKTFSYKEMMAKSPSKVIEIAVQGMLPHNKLRKVIMNKLKVFKDATHKFANQKLEPLTF